MGVQVGVRVFAQVYQEVAKGAKSAGSGNAKQAANAGATAVRSKLSHQMPLDVSDATLVAIECLSMGCFPFVLVTRFHVGTWVPCRDSSDGLCLADQLFCNVLDCEIVAHRA